MWRLGREAAEEEKAVTGESDAGGGGAAEGGAAQSRLVNSTLASLVVSSVQLGWGRIFPEEAGRGRRQGCRRCGGGGGGAGEGSGGAALPGKEESVLAADRTTLEKEK